MAITSYMMMFGLLVWGFSAFVRIYLSEGKQTMVFINRYGEADIELVILLALMVYCLYGLVNLVRMHEKDS